MADQQVEKQAVGDDKQSVGIDPLAHERGINEKLPHNEDPISEYRNEGREDRGWHQGGDWGGGHAANVGESAGEIADEEKDASDQS